MPFDTLATIFPEFPVPLSFRMPANGRNQYVTAQLSKVQRCFAAISQNWHQTCTITFNQLIKFCHEDSIYHHIVFAWINSLKSAKFVRTN